MANFLIRNSLNPNKVVKLGISFQQIVLKGTEGEPVWLVEVATNELDEYGNGIPSEFIHLTSLENLDKEIEKIAAVISDKVDWTPLVVDSRAPFVDSYFPFETSDVNIDSSVSVVINELLPSAGIDLSSIEVALDGFDITNEVAISGDPYSYTLKWKPQTIVYDTYE